VRDSLKSFAQLTENSSNCSVKPKQAEAPRLRAIKHVSLPRRHPPSPLQLPCPSRLKPAGHRGLGLHLNEPSTFTHSKSRPQLWLRCAHSSISEEEEDEDTSYRGPSRRPTALKTQIKCEQFPFNLFNPSFFLGLCSKKNILKKKKKECIPSNTRAI